MIKDLIFTGRLDLFNKIVTIYTQNPTLIFTTLLETTKALRRDRKNVENITDKDFIDIFTLLKKGDISKEAIGEIMSLKADSSQLSINEIKKKLKIKSVSKEDLRKLTLKVVNKNLEMVKKKEMRAKGPLMGEVMKQVRGKIDGSIVSKELDIILKKIIEEYK